MGFLDRLLGRAPQDDGMPRRHATYDGHESPAYGTPPPAPTGPARSEDDVAIDRYRYLLRTAPPEAVEQAHAEAFERLTPEQRRRVLTDLGQQVPPAERATSDDPQSLARMATRAEMRNPGTLERSFGGRQVAPGMGSMIGSSMLGTIAGVVIGSAVANMMFGPMFGDPTADFAGDGGTSGAGDPGATEGDPGATEAGAGAETAGGEPGFTEAGGAGDLGGGFGDFGGGDFGGFGDF
ncbi:hypothetical protein H9623_09445 [Oerskovia sp. Sa1BUA8]|uniref:DUF2076 domain-containing protein n=1 Tax=Oerskovia douganii TaxID=2762210 RepID=A0A9D5UH90_9CELL|nr:hypothetical protein [Oerskovia douganii]MBE7700527.1 hypothetical protein [Oerskovia douganii]